MTAIKPFPNLHYWFILPFLLTLLGFSQYWFNFSSFSLEWHLHGLSATAWYLVLILQPLIFHKSSIRLHRKVGMIALILAGMVTISAISVIKAGNVEQDSVLYSVRYSLSLIDLIFISGFIFSVIMAVLNAKNTQVHARWMITTVFWVLSPATTRLSFVPLGIYFQPKEFADFPFMWSDVFIGNQILITMIIGALILRDFLKERKIYTAFVLVAFAQIVAIPIILGMQDSAWLKGWMDVVFK